MVEPTRVSLYEAKTHLSDLGERAANGEEIIVTKHGRPRFRLVPVSMPVSRPRPGGNPLQISYVADDFDATDVEIERAFGMRD